jgi:autotransporter-associated beta strand protein
MQRHALWGRRLRILAAAVSAAAGFSSAAFSSVTLDPSSSAKITHDPDISQAADPTSTKNVVPLAASSAIYPSVASYSYGSKTLSLTSGGNTASSVAAASAGAVTNSANLGFTLASGTGITQSDPSGTVFGGSAELKMQVDSLFDIGSGGFGPGYGYVNFTITATVPVGGGGSVRVNLKWTDPDNGDAAYRSAYNTTVTFTSGTTTTKTVSSALLLNGGAALASGRHVECSGTITLLAADPLGPVTMAPADFEMSATPPVWRFSPNGAASANFGNGANWTNEMGSFEPSSTPNQVGARAQFLGTTALAGPILVSQPTTLGMLDIDQPGVTLQGVATGAFIFDTQGPNAVMLARNLHDFTEAAHTIAVPVVLNKTLEMTNDATGALVVSSPISGAGGIIKSGLGDVTISNTANSFAGNVIVNQGALIVTGALPPTSSVTVNAGGHLSGTGNGSTGHVGSVVVAGGTIVPGASELDGQVGTLTMNNLMVQGGNLRLDVADINDVDRINVLGNASFSGSCTITPVLDNIGSITPGAYTLLTATAGVTLPPGQVPKLNGVPTTSRLNFTLDTSNPNALVLNIGGAAPRSLVWIGAAGAAWDVNTSQNWHGPGNILDHYFDYDTVTFDDTAANPDVDLNGLVSPAAINVNTNTVYTFTSAFGTGGITGPTGLTKTGSGLLAVGLSNSYTGATQVQQGTLQILSSTALNGTSPLVLGANASPAALDLAGFTATVRGLTTAGAGNNKIITNSAAATGTLAFTSGISTFGGIIQDDGPVALHILSGALTLTGNNTYTGPTTIDSLATDNEADLPGTTADGAAILQVGNGGTTGTIGLGPVLDDGVLIFNRSDTVSVPNNISDTNGSGQLIKMGAGTLTLSGSNTFGGGLFVRGGTLAFINDSNLGGGTAPVTLDGGKLVVPSNFVTGRPIYLGTGGGTLDTSSFDASFLNVSGSGAFTKMGGGALTTNAISAQALSINAGKIVIAPGRDTFLKRSYVQSLNIISGNTLDLNDNDLIYDYNHNGVADPAQSTFILNLINSGFAGGNWNGPGITSTAARAIALLSSNPHKTALGYAEASAAGLTVFDRLATDGDMIVIRYTMAGDANLDGVVNALDFNALASGYGMQNGRWVNGDFNYNGVVDTSDFTHLAINFGQSLLPSPVPASIVPEPAAALFLAIPRLLRRRRKVL